MDIRASRKDFEGSIIINRGYCDQIFNFMKYDLNIRSDNFYNHWLYGWNWSIHSLNNTFKNLRYNVYVISAYRSSPARANYINYDRINKYFKRIIKNYNKKTDNLSWREKEKLNKVYIKNITKKLNSFLEEDIKNHSF